MVMVVGSAAFFIHLIQCTMPTTKNAIVFEHDGQPVTTSRLIADRFNKLHKHVLMSIHCLECSDEFSRTNFRPTYWKDSFGRMQPEYIITFDGFTFLVMGFTGKVAAKFKEDYINAFRSMQNRLNGKAEVIKVDRKPIQRQTAVLPYGWSDQDLRNMMRTIISLNDRLINLQEHVINNMGGRVSW